MRSNSKIDLYLNLLITQSQEQDCQGFSKVSHHHHHHQEGSLPGSNRISCVANQCQQLATLPCTLSHCQCQHHPYHPYHRHHPYHPHRHHHPYHTRQHHHGHCHIIIVTIIIIIVIMFVILIFIVINLVFPSPFLTNASNSFNSIGTARVEFLFCLAKFSCNSFQV